MALSYAGRFNDGRSAASHEVTVEVTGDELFIRDAEGRSIATWRMDDLTPVGVLGKRGPVRLMNSGSPEARLTVDDDGFRRPLLALAPHLRGGGMLRRRPLRTIGLWVAGVGAAAALLFLGIPRLAEPIAAMVPPEWEDAMGAAVVAEMTGESGVCSGGQGEEALDRLVARLAAPLDTPYEFTVIVSDDPMINAYAAPGGHIVILRGLLEFARGPDEVAGVLAHEMGHVVERHATEGLVRALGLALVIEVLIGDASGLIGVMGGAGALLLELSFSREDESAADAVALAVLEQADISPRGLADFLARLDEELPALPDDLAILSTHPPSSERAEALSAAGYRGTPALGERDWRTLRTICR